MQCCWCKGSEPRQSEQFAAGSARIQYGAVIVFGNPDDRVLNAEPQAWHVKLRKARMDVNRFKLLYEDVSGRPFHTSAGMPVDLRSRLRIISFARSLAKP